MAETGGASERVDLLIVAAHAIELEGLREALGPVSEVRTFGTTQVTSAVVGVGLCAAGAGTARALALHAPGAVLLIGSYGAYPRAQLEVLPGPARVIESVRLLDSAVLRGHAAFPAPMATEVVLERGLVAQLERFGATRMRTLGNTLSVTTDDALARELDERSECEGENLECIAVAHACELARVPCAAVLSATNRVGARGRSDWLKHHAQAARDTARIVLAYLHAGAPRAA